MYCLLSLNPLHFHISIHIVPSVKNFHDSSFPYQILPFLQNSAPVLPSPHDIFLEGSQIYFASNALELCGTTSLETEGGKHSPLVCLEGERHRLSL